jgi:hypothetical protein
MLNVSRYAECHDLFIVMLNVIMLSVVEPETALALQLALFNATAYFWNAHS